MTKRNCIYFFAVAVLALLTGVSSAQVATGIPPFSSIGGGPFDQINLGNLNVHFSIPIVNKAGRGMPFSYNLTYDNSVWTAIGAAGHQSWQPVTLSWGWQGLTQITSANVTYSTTTSSGRCGTMGQYTWQSWQYSNFVYEDASGTKHPISYSPSYITSTGTPNQNCPPTGPNPSTAYPVPTTDNSGYSMIAIPGQGSVSTSIGTSNGATLTPTSVIDANGNEITNNGSVYTDTLGQTALTVTGLGTPSSPVLLTYTGPSGSQSFTAAYKATAVTTSFGCSGIGEFSGTVNLVKSITLPDNSSYQFSYYADGRLEEITLPTGGTITYAYTGTNKGINCSDGSTIGMTRTLSPGGTWTYSRAYTGSNNVWTTTVVDPSTPGNTTVINFAKDNASSNYTYNFYETQRLVYQGSTSGTLLSDTYNCWGDTGNCAYDAVSTPIVNQFAFRKLSNGTLAGSWRSYSGSLVTEDKEYDWGYVAGHSGAVTDTIDNYTQLSNGIPVLGSVITNDINQNLVLQTTYAYDETAVTTTTGTPQHLGGSGPRGNVTSITTYSTSSNYLTQHFTYYDTGTVNTATDVNRAVTTNVYGTGSCGNSFPTQVNMPLSLSTSATWNCVGGVQLTAVDVNGNTTTTAYTDPNYWHPASITYPDGGQTSFTYNSPNQTTVTRKMNGTQNLVTSTIVDGFGRTTEQQLQSDPVSTVYADTSYNNVGQVNCVKNPYRTSRDPTYGQTCYQYDALGRTTQITNPDGTYQTITYTNRATEVQDEGNGNGASRVAKIYQTDGLGRLSSVCEVTSVSQMGNGGTPASCGLDISATGFITNYTYSALGSLLAVSQNGLNGRSYTYDMLSRLTTETNPETNYSSTANTISYSYDSCSAGDLCSRTTPQPNQTGTATVTTSYSYDTLHRLTGKTYSDGTTNSIVYEYDQTAPWGWNLGNPKGNLTEEYTANSSGALTAQIFSRDSMGRLLGTSFCTPINCSGASYGLDYTYDFLGDLATEYNTREGVTYTNAYNSAAELTSFQSNLVNSAHPATLYTVNQYNPLGQVAQATYGNGLVDNDQFDNRGRMTSRAVGPSNNYLYSVSLGYASDSDVLEGFDSVNGSWYYAYDDFNRLRAATLGSMEYSYGYDRFGNRWQQSGGTINPSYSFDNNNHVTGSGVVYDAAGNITNDGVGHNYTYDAEGRMIAVDGGSTATYLYDANGQRVEETVDGGAATDFLYDVQGHMVTEASATNWDRSELYAGNNHVALYANGTTYFMHNDWLGSTKQQSDMSGNSAQWCSYLPFADGFNCPGSQLSLMSFTGDQWDGETGLSHTLFRQYNPTEGRWMTPDPAGMAAADPTNPQSWNRYAYVMNSPLNLVDPLGLDAQCTTDNNGHMTCNTQGSAPLPPPPPGCMYIMNEQGRYLGEICDFGPNGSGNLGMGISPGFDTTNFFSTTQSSGSSGGCFTPNALQKLGIPLQAKVAKFLGHPVGVGLGGSAGAGIAKGFGFYGTASGQMIVAPNGNAFLVFSYGGTGLTSNWITPVTKGIGATVGFQASSMTTQNPKNLAGGAVDMSAGAGDLFGGGGDVAIGPDGSVQGTLTGGLAYGGFGGAGAITRTTVIPSCSNHK